MASENGKRRRPPADHAAHGGGHHGGAWKVAYADFTTAMMAFFLLLWILSSASPEQKQSIANYFREQGPFREGGATRGGGALKNGSGLMPNAGDQFLEMQKRVGGGALSDQVRVTMGEDGLVIELADDKDDAIFAVGSAAMEPKFATIFDEIAHSLAELPNRVRIEGYTDGRQYPPGAAYTNWELSADRANAARRRLEGHGLARDRFESIAGLGDGYPAIPEEPLAPGNRRITITVLNETELPDQAEAAAEPGVPANAATSADGDREPARGHVVETSSHAPGAPDPH
jgi:chemotaxis protein MotB